MTTLMTSQLQVTNQRAVLILDLLLVISQQQLDFLLFTVLIKATFLDALWHYPRVRQNYAVALNNYIIDIRET